MMENIRAGTMEVAKETNDVGCKGDERLLLHFHKTEYRLTPIQL